MCIRDRDGLLPLLEEIALLFPHGETNGRSAGLACQEAESGALTLGQAQTKAWRDHVVVPREFNEGDLVLV